METKLIKGLSQVQSKYDAFFIDLWGVIHNGIELYPGAIEVLKNLNKLNKRFVLISNAPRPSKSVKKYLLNLKMDRSLLKNIFTSGEAALHTLREKIYGEKFYHIGPERDKDLVKAFEKNKTTLAKCEFILCTGLFEDEENSIDYYNNLLENYTKIKMICTNPDLIVDRGEKREYCAGSVAKSFEEIKGKVIYFGKPHPPVYNLSTNLNNKRVLCIGDNLNTDIKGANIQNFDSLLITNGIHRQEILEIELDHVLKKYEVNVEYTQKILKW